MLYAENVREEMTKKVEEKTSVEDITSFIERSWWEKLTNQGRDGTISSNGDFNLSTESQAQLKTIAQASNPAAVSTQLNRDVITKDLDKKIRNRLNGTIDIIDSRPCFLKPTYLLQNATPYVSAKLVMIGGNEGILAYDFLPASELGRSQNIIKSFEYDVDNASVKLSITDADQDIIEYMGYLFANLLLTNPPILEVDFGWAHDKEQQVIQGNYIADPLDEVSKAKIDTHVYFRRTVFCYINDFESQYTPEGVLELTFLGKMSQNFPPPYQHFLPYDLLGRSPAVSIQMIHTLFVFYNYFKDKKEIKYSDLEYVGKFFFDYKHITEEKTLSNIIFKTLNFFIPIGVVGNANLTGGLSSKWVKQIDIAIKSWKENKEAVPKSFEEIVPSNSTPTNPTSYYSKISTIFQGSMMDSVENLRLQLKGFNDNYSTSLRQYVMDLTPILNVALIHPYDVIKYVENCLEKQAIKYKFTKNKNLFYMQGFEDNNIGGYNYKDKTYTKEERERYLIKSGDITINPTSSWDQLFNSLTTKCFVWINESDAEVLNRKDEETSKTKDKKTQVSMTGNCFVVKKKEALFNLNTFKMILQARTADSTINKLKEGKGGEKTSLEHIKDTINKINALENDDWVVLVSYDVIPGMNNLFDPLNGKNQILQAYSCRSGNVLAFTDSEGKDIKQYNPGYPNVWSINFPDVISFQPKFNFKNQTDNLANVMKQGMTDFQQRIEEEKAELERLNNDVPKKGEEKEHAKKIKIANESIDSLNNQQATFNKYHGRMPYKNPALMMDDDPFINISKHGEVNNRRKKMQEFRKHAILSSVNIDVDMEVLGDPIFNIHSKGKYLFIKYFTQLGDLSFFTGVYIIGGIKHSISAGRYTTSFTLQKDATVASTEVAGQIFRGFTENDNCYS